MAEPRLDDADLATRMRSASLDGQNQADKGVVIEEVSDDIAKTYPTLNARVFVFEPAEPHVQPKWQAPPEHNTLCTEKTLDVYHGHSPIKHKRRESWSTEQENVQGHARKKSRAE